LKRSPKKIIRNGIELFHCPDCDDYLPKGEMSTSKRQKDGVGVYCRKHRRLRNQESKRKSIKRKNEKYKLNYRISKVHKYYFKGAYRIKSVSIRPRTTGICVNWGKIKYERREFV
jgi:hypothetical protein